MRLAPFPVIGLLLTFGLPAIGGDRLPGFRPEQIGVIVNAESRDSIEIGRYYVSSRQIPRANLISVHFRPDRPALDPSEFAAVRAEAEIQTPAGVEAFALTWTQPYRVGCMSITTAFATGFDERFCAADCRPTRPLPYFNSDSASPWRDYKIRPTMALAGNSVAAVKALIDRGIASDATFPKGTGYLVSTTDKARNVRAAEYPTIVHVLGDRIRLEQVNANYIEKRTDVLFYFTGLARVPALDTLRFLPGAMADHLTSVGGVLSGSFQMSSTDWLAAGATGSYGTVVEPCSIREKFPAPGVAIRRYLDGETLIEAYWKSVAQPGQGIFIGEPLSAPFRRAPRDRAP